MQALATEAYHVLESFVPRNLISNPAVMSIDVGKLVRQEKRRLEQLRIRPEPGDSHWQRARTTEQRT